VYNPRWAVHEYHLLSGQIQTNRNQEAETRPNKARIYTLPRRTRARIRADLAAFLRCHEVRVAAC
jgi:hypothetical protein